MKFVNSQYRPNPSGRLGATIFSKNKSGYYEKMFIPPSQPRTDEQVQVRENFTTLSRKWATLTALQRKGWGLLTDVIAGSQSGFDVFMKLNRNLQDIGMAIIANAPQVILYPEQLADFQADIVSTPGAEDITLNFTGLIAADTKVKVFASKPLQPGRKAQRTTLRQIGVIDSTFVSTDSIKDLYIAKYGSLPGAGVSAMFGIEVVLKSGTSAGIANGMKTSVATGTI